MSKESQAKLEKLFIEVMGENVHTAFRKGSDHPSADEVWKTIQAMPEAEWGKVVGWMCWALAYSLDGDIEIKSSVLIGRAAYFLHLLLCFCVTFPIFAVGTASAHDIGKTSRRSEVGIHVQRIAVAPNVNHRRVGNSVLVHDSPVNRDVLLGVALPQGSRVLRGNGLLNQIVHFLPSGQCPIVMARGCEVFDSGFVIYVKRGSSDNCRPPQVFRRSVTAIHDDRAYDVRNQLGIKRRLFNVEARHTDIRALRCYQSGMVDLIGLKHRIPLVISDASINGYDEECKNFNGKFPPLKPALCFAFGCACIVYGWYSVRFGRNWRRGIGGFLFTIFGMGACFFGSDSFLLWNVCGHENFVVFTNWHLPHVAQETEERAMLGKLTDSLMGCLFDPLPADLGYHSRKPMYEGQLPMGAEKFNFDQKEILKGATGDIEIPTRVATGTFTPCEYVDGGPCYYDGSTLNAEPVFDVLLREGSAGVWRELRKFYMETFRRADE